MVAIVILAIGLLGIARMNLIGLKSSVDSSAKAAAVQLSYEIIDKMRENYSATTAATYLNGAAFINTNVALPNCYTASCDENTQATHDLIAWAKSINDLSVASVGDRRRAARLPDGLAVVCRDITPESGSVAAGPQCSGGANDPMTVKIIWTERGTNAADGATIERRYVTNFDLLLPTP